MKKITSTTRYSNEHEKALAINHPGQRLEVVRSANGHLAIGLFHQDDINLENPAFVLTDEEELALRQLI